MGDSIVALLGESNFNVQQKNRLAMIIVTQVFITSCGLQGKLVLAVSRAIETLNDRLLQRDLQNYSRH